MTFRTCLLVSDDPDHHLEFSEALEEVSPDTILVTIASRIKAIELLRAHVLVPQFLFLDDGADGASSAEFVRDLSKDKSLSDISVTILSERGPKKLDGHIRYFYKDHSYVELREFLTKLINP